MSNIGRGSFESEGIEALRHMKRALKLLDMLDLDVEVGAHLDLAVCRLRKALRSRRNSDPKPWQLPSE